MFVNRDIMKWVFKIYFCISYTTIQFDKFQVFTVHYYFIIRLMHSIIQNLKRLKSTFYKSLKDTKLKITATCFGSYVIHHQGVQSCAWLELLMVIHRSKLKLYWTLIRPIVTYACEIWGLKEIWTEVVLDINQTYCNVCLWNMGFKRNLNWSCTGH
jgi:hypothetical protein